MKRSNFPILIFTAVLLLCSACQSEIKGPQVMKADNLVKSFQKRLIEAKAGDQILLPPGTFEFKRSISLIDIPGITIKGAGKGKTILSFKGQIEGAEGMLIKNVDGITLEGFTISDSKGDAIKTQACKNVVFRDVETTWTTGQLPTNGAYGLYPVSCTNVLMEKCEASYAMDAGIYVGQSTNVVVRDNYVHHNVAGLEIENTINGEVYNNIAKENTAGMLIFDMPDLPQANGDKIKFYNNVMENNNGKNFAPKGMIVSTLPPGTGMNLMSHSNIEVHHNTIKNHNTVGILINSWFITGKPFKSKDFDPFSTNIHIHDNIIERAADGKTDTSTESGQLLTAISSGKALDMVTDGVFKPGLPDINGNASSYCMRNNGDDIRFVNLNAHKGPTVEDFLKNMDTNYAKFDCDLPDFDTTEHDKWLAVK